MCTLSVTNQMKKWEEPHFPPMPTKFYDTHSNHKTIPVVLIVAGGANQSNQLDTVEVMDIETLVWSTAASLPHSYYRVSATICGDQLDMLGGYDKSDIKNKVINSIDLFSDKAPAVMQ